MPNFDDQTILVNVITGSTILEASSVNRDNQTITITLFSDPVNKIPSHVPSYLYVPHHIHSLREITDRDEDLFPQYLTVDRGLDLIQGYVCQLLGNGTLTSGADSVTGGKNVGGGVGIFAGKQGNLLQFYSLVAGNNVSITKDGDTIVIDAVGGSSDPFSITSFNGTPVLTSGTGGFSGSLIELGATVSSFNFTASFVRVPDDSNLTDPDVVVSNLVTDLGVTLDVGVAFPYTKNFQVTGEVNLNTSKTFILDAEEGPVVDTRSKNFSWVGRVIYGTAAATGFTGFYPNLDDPVTDYATTPSLQPLVNGLANKVLATDQFGNFSVTAGATDKIYYAWPAQYGLTGSFQVGAFPDGFFKVADDIPIVNQYGEVITYVLYESDQVNLGSVTGTVS